MDEPTHAQHAMINQIREDVLMRRKIAHRKYNQLNALAQKATRQMMSLDNVLKGKTLETKVKAVLDAAVTIGFKFASDFKINAWGKDVLFDNGKVKSYFETVLKITDSGNIILNATEKYSSKYEFNHDNNKGGTRRCPIARISFYKELKITDNSFVYLIKRTSR